MFSRPPVESPASTTEMTEPLLYPVVLIDDDPDDLFFITRRIAKAGTRNPVITFGDGADAVRHFGQLCQTPLVEPPACLVLCDIKMPRMDGFQVLQWFRSQPRLAGIHFVMLSGSNEQVDRSRAAELGANDYLVKFPTEQQFRTVIGQANSDIVSAFRRSA